MFVAFLVSLKKSKNLGAQNKSKGTQRPIQFFFVLAASCQLWAVSS
jgi:hypothetical protein